MSQLILDLSDPAIAEMVSQWKEGGTYRIELNVTQGATKGSLVPFEVNEILDYAEAGAAETEEGAPVEGDMAAEEIAGLPSKQAPGKGLRPEE